MKVIRFLLIISIAIFLFSCSNIYNEHETIDEMQWYRKDVKTFEVNIPEDGNYDLFFAMRHSTGYPFTSIKIEIEQVTPSKEEFIKKAEFSVADEKGNYIGEVTGQLWDTENIFSGNTPLIKGKYIFKIGHAMNSDPIILVIDVGIIVRKSNV